MVHRSRILAFLIGIAVTAQAKAIYAYFSSFAGAGTTAFPRRATIMRELKIGSLDTYYQHFNLLIQYGYLSAEQRKINGRFDICIYRLNDMVDPEATPNPLPPKRKKGMSEKTIHDTDGTSIDIFDYVSVSLKNLLKQPFVEQLSNKL